MLVIRLLIGGLVLCSLFGNVLFFLSDGLPLIEVKYNNYVQKHASEPLGSVEEFRDALYEGGLKQVLNFENKIAPEQLTLFPGNIKRYFRLNSRKDIYRWPEMGYLMVGITEEAIRRNDTLNIQRIREVFDKYCLDDRNLITNQSLLGIVALDLHDYTHEKKYMEFADRLYDFLSKDCWDDEIGIFYWTDNKIEQGVDGLGMYCPFLMRYSKVTGNSHAAEISAFSLNQYIKYGVDKETGIAAHGFLASEPFTKMGSINWGRGNSWYVLALMVTPDSLLTEESRLAVDRFNASLTALYEKNHDIGEFLAERNDKKIDLSAAIPLAYYLTKQGTEVTEKEMFSYSKYLHNGLLFCGSGSSGGMNVYSPFFGLNLLSNGVMLMWLNDK